MLILEKMFGAKKNVPFNEIIGHEHIKKLFQLVLQSDQTNHILLTGPPASAKMMFLLSMRDRVKNTCFVEGGNTTGRNYRLFICQSSAVFTHRRN